jgi:ribonuclease HI
VLSGSVGVDHRGEPTKLLTELFGSVETNQSSPFYLGATVKSNNTAELSALGEAFLWLRDFYGSDAQSLAASAPVPGTITAWTSSSRSSSSSSGAGAGGSSTSNYSSAAAIYGNAHKTSGSIAGTAVGVQYSSLSAVTVNRSQPGGGIAAPMSSAAAPSSSVSRKISVCIRYDSEYAAKSVQGIFNGQKNTELIHKIRAIYKSLLAGGRRDDGTIRDGMKIHFEKVPAHSGVKWNERADQLALQGRTMTCRVGRYRYYPYTSAAAAEYSMISTGKTERKGDAEVEILGGGKRQCCDHSAHNR